MNRWEAMKELSVDAAAQALVFDDEGFERGCCPVCQRTLENNCNDECFRGVKEYLNKDAG